MLLTLTFVFAGIEEVAQSVLVSRMGVPDAVSTWIGAGAVALLVGPLRDRFQKWVARLAGEKR